MEFGDKTDYDWISFFVSEKIVISKILDFIFLQFYFKDKRIFSLITYFPSSLILIKSMKNRTLQTILHNEYKVYKYTCHIL